MQKIIGVTDLQRRFRAVLDEVVARHVPYVLEEVDVTPLPSRTSGVEEGCTGEPSLSSMKAAASARSWPPSRR
jgi:hypothetical protein